MFRVGFYVRQRVISKKNRGFVLTTSANYFEKVNSNAGLEGFTVLMSRLLGIQGLDFRWFDSTSIFSGITGRQESERGGETRTRRSRPTIL